MKTKQIQTLHFITNQHCKISITEQVEKACKAGVSWVQLRLKNTNDTDFLSIAIKVKDICMAHNAILIINDNINIARDIDADGVHTGKNDMHPAEVRKILGKNKIIGCTANSFQDIKNVYKYANYIGLGPFNFTKTKDKLSPLLGIKGNQEIIENCKLNNIHIPIIAIGGILPIDVPEIIKTGVFGIAISSGIVKDENIMTNTNTFLTSLQLKN